MHKPENFLDQRKMNKGLWDSDIGKMLKRKELWIIDINVKRHLSL